MTVDELLKNTEILLAGGEVESPEAEAKLIVSHCTEMDFTHLLLERDTEIKESVVDAVNKFSEERLSGRPVQYVLGETDFYGLLLKVGEGVLIPRPETEVMVEKVLDLYPQTGGDVLDLCTGSGAVALAIQAELTNSCRIFAVDLCETALSYAKDNCDFYAGKFPQRPVSLFQGDLFEPLPSGQKFAVITANPPYVTEDEYRELPSNVKDFEPKLALTADDHGLAIIRRIAKQSPDYLVDGGFVMCEMGWQQGPAALAIFKNHFSRAEVVKDYTGRDRFILAFK